MSEDPLAPPPDEASYPGPSDPNHLMHRTHASNSAILGLVIYSVFAGAVIAGFGLSAYSRVTDFIITTTTTTTATTTTTTATTTTTTATTTTTTTLTSAPGATPSATSTSTTAATSTRPIAATASPTSIPDLSTTSTTPARPARSPDTDLLILVALAGALGGLVHLLTSLGSYVGARRLMRSWIVFYFLRPLAGAGLAIGTYFVLRMTTPDVEIEKLNLFSILSFAILSGLFARQALDKLAQVFETMFQKVEEKVESKSLDELVYHAEDALPLDPETPPAEDTFGDTEDATPPEPNKDKDKD